MSFGVFFFFFFFKQKTAYEMRISDWSSDVCSSDLLEELAEDGGGTDHDRAPSFSASATTAGSSVARPASRPRLSAASSEQPRLSVASSALIAPPRLELPQWIRTPPSRRASSSF